MFDTRLSGIRYNVSFPRRVAGGLRIKMGDKDKTDMSDKVWGIKMCENMTYEEENRRAQVQR